LVDVLNNGCIRSYDVHDDFEDANVVYI